MTTQRIFISYRRADTDNIVDRMFDVLAALFGAENVFRDVDSIDTGVRFDEAMLNAVKQSKVFLAVIGDKWLTAQSEDRSRRLDRDDDPVYLEIKTALENGVPTIPVLVNGAGMPNINKLPESLKPLSFINAFVIRDSTFHRDLGRLCGYLKDYDPAAFARKMSPAHWVDLVISSESRDRFTLALDDLRLKEKLDEDWGFGRFDSRKGMTIALWGPAGCGKTLAARTFAHELGLDLYQIDLEEVLLRWNLGDKLPIDWLFRRTAANPILLQIRDTKGAFSDTPSGSGELELVAANLIRQFEERDQLIIVTTRSALRPDAILPWRFDHIVELPFPNVKAREYIWEQSMPVEMPREENIDYAVLARHALSGASICRVVKRAALYAALEDRFVSMMHLEKAIQVEQTW